MVAHEKNGLRPFACKGRLKIILTIIKVVEYVRIVQVAFSEPGLFPDSFFILNIDSPTLV